MVPLGAAVLQGLTALWRHLVDGGAVWPCFRAWPYSRVSAAADHRGSAQLTLPAWAPVASVARHETRPLGRGIDA